MGKNKIGEALQKIASGQSEAPQTQVISNGNQPMQPTKKIPRLTQMWIAKASNNYKPGQEIGEEGTPEVNMALHDNMVKGMDLMFSPNQNIDTKDPDWAKKDSRGSLLNTATKIIDWMDQNNVSEEQALSVTNRFLNDPGYRNMIIKDDKYSPLQIIKGNPKEHIGSNSNWWTEGTEGGNRLQYLGDQIAAKYRQLKRDRKIDYETPQGAQMGGQQPVNIQTPKIIEEKTNIAPKLRVTKTP